MQTTTNGAGTVYCDSCTAGFAPQLVETPTPDGGARQTFDCPSCGDVYLVATFTARGLQLRDQLAEAQRLAAAIKRELAGEMTRHGD